MASETGGAWGAALKLAAGDKMSSVSCAAPGNCTAGGDSIPPGLLSRDHATVLDETNGKWGNPTAVSGTKSIPFPELNSISCPSTGACAAVGAYDQNRPKAFVVDETNGHWGKPIHPFG